MRVTQTLRVKSPADLLAAVPALIGLVPSRSVVIVILRGGHTGALRFDIPEDESRATLKGVTTHITGLLCKVTGIRSLYIVVYADEAIETELPHRVLVDVMLRRFEHAGFSVGDALCTANNGWGSYLEIDEPLTIHPLADIHEASTRMPSSPPSTTSVDSIPSPTPAESRRTREALQQYRDTISSLRDTDDYPPELEPLSDLHQFAEDALQWDEQTLEATATLLLFAIQSPQVRDATMLQWAFGYDVGNACYAEDETARREGTPTHERDETFAELLMGNGPPPSRQRMEQGIRLLKALIATIDGPETCAPLTMLAWLSWALGRGSHACTAVDRARRINPDYGMAELLDTIFATGRMPEWIFTAPDEATDPL